MMSETVLNNAIVELDIYFNRANLNTLKKLKPSWDSKRSGGKTKIDSIGDFEMVCVTEI